MTPPSLSIVTAFSSCSMTFVRARAFLKDGKVKEALAASEEAIALNDKRWEAYVVAASAYSSQQLFDDAVGMLQSALTRAPEDRKPLIRDALAETRRALSTPLPQPAGANAVAPAGPAPAVSAPTQGEIVLWKSIEKSTTATDFSAYLATYPNGIYAPLAKTRFETLTAASKTPQQKIADVVGKIQNLSNNAKWGNFTQTVFTSACRLSFVVMGKGGGGSYTVDLGDTEEKNLSVENNPANGLWWVTGLRSPKPGLADVRAKDQDSASQLFALLPEAIQLCKTAPGSR